MPSPIFISNPPPGFSAIAVCRGLQLALLGAWRTLQNPALFRSKYYSEALTAIKYSILIQLVLWSPVVALRVLAYALNLVVDWQFAVSAAHWLRYLQFSVLNLSVFVFSGARHFSRSLDELFLCGLQYVDQVYLKKHPDKQDHQFHANLVSLSEPPKDEPSWSWHAVQQRYHNSQPFAAFVKRHLTRAVVNLAVLVISRLPYVGSIIVGLISFSNLNDKLGTSRALTVCLVLQMVPRTYSVAFLTTYWGSRSMVHDLLVPYFSRVRLTNLEKDQWIKAREGLLFGFGLCFFLLIQLMPWVGLLIFGFAESSVAYLVTKVTDPPPSSPQQLIHWNSTQLVWSREKEQSVIKGEFAAGDDGYTPIPGSFIFA